MATGASRLTDLIDQFARPSDKETMLERGPYSIYGISPEAIGRALNIAGFTNEKDHSRDRRIIRHRQSDRSKDGPYERLAKAINRGNEKYYDGSPSTSPILIANLISTAIKSANPKTRYVAGKMAKPVLFLRRWLSDKMFDRAMLSQVK